MKTLFLLISLVLILVSCQKEESEIKSVLADFTVGDTLLKVGENIAIVNLSDSVSAEYYWDFGDGTLSGEKTPNHFYSSPGEYVVKLRVTDNAGNSDSTLRTVRVGEYFVYELVINSLAAQKWYPDFGNWDADSTGINAMPDVFFSITEPDAPSLYESETIYNVASDRLPLSFKIPDIKIIPFDLNRAGIYLNDKDGLAFETMASNLMSGVSFPDHTYDKINHTGKFTVNFFSSFTVRYRIK
jgi:hypothetical protein